MQIIKPEEQKVMSLAILGKTSFEIATFTNLPENDVKDILNSPAVRGMIQDIEISNVSNQLTLSRMKWWQEIIDSIIAWAKKIVSAIDDGGIDPTKWNKNHIELFKMILAEQAKLDKKILDEIQNRINITTNNITINVRSDTQALEGILAKLPAKAQESYWQDVIALGKKYAQEYSRVGWNPMTMKIISEQ